ncbi:PHB depolymerase family esterase [Paucibacter sp. O1-1]|uniref:extracellular catalytic domain type 1 short-chain-length polyhydroxyalkanoate depolymerase n=1 Tax=Paucibacter sp. M5-1 TaxID=3015998 RepID=UPI0021D4D446|nr:PHB depolymerase family esterase [Paucibacter sp. M5-1]MCU7373429.1 PHB depolymerase family esterase [Paucibacter sp. O1-1]MCZ7879722.1 PHB depolymerase family esterase [Paucibacter sp. M5-1]MDA3828429.1 PHB depolymerase family esterase [Paucibacter sp. O1-1]
MAKRKPAAAWTRLMQQSWSALTRSNLRVGRRAVAKAIKPVLASRKPPPGAGDWLAGAVMGPAGMRRYWLYRPPGLRLKPGERLPLLVMLHGCGQSAPAFAASTRMNRVAAREGFLVIYPEQDRLANAQGCWNWFDTRSGRAYNEAALILQAIDQVCLLYPADRERVALAGLSAGASMAALLASRYPERFKAVVMHSGIPPGTAHSGLSALGAMRGRRATEPLPAPAASAWPPLLVIHGSRDAVVAPSNGRAAVLAWAEAADARVTQPRSVRRGKRYPSTVTDVKRGATTVASLVEVDGLGHAWSGGLASQPFGDGQGPDASRMVWAFVARQFRR